MILWHYKQLLHVAFLVVGHPRGLKIQEPGSAWIRNRSRRHQISILNGMDPPPNQMLSQLMMGCSGMLVVCCWTDSRRWWTSLTYQVPLKSCFWLDYWSKCKYYLSSMAGLRIRRPARVVSRNSFEGKAWFMPKAAWGPVFDCTCVMQQTWPNIFPVRVELDRFSSQESPTER